MQEAAVARLNLGNDLRRAIDGSQFIVLHQPVVDVRTGEVVGSEALVRWAHPQRGLILPDEFIAVTEDTGLITEVGRRVLDAALEDAAGWARRHDLGDFTQSVNVSARQLTTNLTALVAEALERHSWPAERLCLELTESVLMRRPRRHPRGAPQPEGPRRPVGHRRLRHRLLVAHLPAAAAGRPRQDRPVVRDGPLTRRPPVRRRPGHDRHRGRSGSPTPWG